MKLPLLSQRADFKSLCGGMRLEARGGAGEGSEASDGVYDISNSDRLGKSEVNFLLYTNCFLCVPRPFLHWTL